LKANAAHIEKVFYSDKDHSKTLNLLAQCREKRIKVYKEGQERLNLLAGTSKHQGVVALISDFKYRELAHIIDAWKMSGEKALILILDGIEDPHNLGAIIRSAEAAGVHGIIIPKNRAVSVTSTVEKVSAGAVEHVNIAMVTNISKTIDELKKEGLWVAGAEASGEASLFKSDFNCDIALVIGGEGKGIRHLVKEGCDFIFSIPMKGKVNSLNASVSTALVLYEVVRQREWPLQ